MRRRWFRDSFVTLSEGSDCFMRLSTSEWSQCWGGCSCWGIADGEGSASLEGMVWGTIIAERSLCFLSAEGSDSTMGTASADGSGSAEERASAECSASVEGIEWVKIKGQTVLKGLSAPTCQPELPLNTAWRRTGCPLCTESSVYCQGSHREFS